MLALVPGPDNLFVLTHSAVHGVRGGLRITLGLCTGLVVHTAAVALGVGALIQSSSWALTALKLFGAGYLLYLAWKTWAAPYAMSAPDRTDSGERSGKTERTCSGKPEDGLYRRGVIMNMSNPKVLMFFLAFLPQFVSPGSVPGAWQVVFLGGVFIVCALLVFSSIALLAGWLSGRLRQRPQTVALMNRIAGWIFIALALRLVFSSS